MHDDTPSTGHSPSKYVQMQSTNATCWIKNTFTVSKNFMEKQIHGNWHSSTLLALQSKNHTLPDFQLFFLHQVTVIIKEIENTAQFWITDMFQISNMALKSGSTQVVKMLSSLMGKTIKCVSICYDFKHWRPFCHG